MEALQLDNVKYQSQLDQEVNFSFWQKNKTRFFKRRKNETKLAKSRSNTDALHKRVVQLEDELKRTISSYQTLVISLEKQNEQQGTSSLTFSL